MEYRWLQRNPNASHVIVIFGGWAIGPEVFAHLQTDSDLLYLWDYRDLNIDLPKLKHYETRSLIAWSFGVASYCYWQKDHADIFERKIAINGCPRPIDRHVGIPPHVMQMTIDRLSEESYQIFLTRCFGKKQHYQTIDVSARKAELIAIQKRDYNGIKLQWDKVWISRHDKIFSVANMQRVSMNNKIILDAPHVPFATWKTWDEVLF